MVERQKRPTNDISSAIANAKLPNGTAMPPMEMLGYYFLLVLAGNETTRNATSSGLQAFIENTEQFHPAEAGSFADQACGRRDPSLGHPGHPFRTQRVGRYRIRGHTIRRGESVCLFYPSANRDEEVFEEPFKFDISRNPNPHIAFGIGEHFCLGANLARLELEVIFRELARRLEYAEPAGPLERLRSSFFLAASNICRSSSK
jgi:cholest-4-en-3-one 26-monooxygenase